MYARKQDTAKIIILPFYKNINEMNTRERLISKWNNLEFGLRTRVYKEHNQGTVLYILKTESYDKEERMSSIIECIDRIVLEFEEEVKRKSKKIKSI